MGSGTVPKFEDIVEKIYAAVDERILWNDVASDIAHAAGAVSCSLQVRRGGTAKIVGAAGYKEFDPKLYEHRGLAAAEPAEGGAIERVAALVACARRGPVRAGPLARPARPGGGCRSSGSRT